MYFLPRGAQNETNPPECLEQYSYYTLKLKFHIIIFIYFILLFQIIWKCHNFEGSPKGIILLQQFKVLFQIVLSSLLNKYPGQKSEIMRG